MLDYSKISLPNEFAALNKRSFIIGLSLFTSFLIIARLFLCNQTLGLDEAEQVVFAQTLSPGYPAQPPLYTWIQYIIFQVLGSNLFSFALLKYSLFATSVYVYYLICRLYCQDNVLAFCAALSWILIPSISYDLLPHRTHAILALLAANLTWYWFIKPSKLSSRLWYAILGCIISVGLLSKFNYLLFLLFFVLVAVSISEYRRIILNRRILITISIALLLSSPYWTWLITNAPLGLNAAGKLRLAGKTQLNGLLCVLETCLFFVTPLIVMRFYFSPSKHVNKIQNCFVRNPAKILLRHYHIAILPLLFSFVLLVGVYNFKTHWILPLLFLSPVFAFSEVAKEGYTKRSVKRYLSLCLAVQLVLISTWIFRTPALARFPMDALIQEIKQDDKPVDYLASDSHWLLGSLMWRLPVYHGVFLHPFKPVTLPNGNALVVWEGKSQMLTNLIQTDIKQMKHSKTLTNRAYQFKSE